MQVTSNNPYAAYQNITPTRPETLPAQTLPEESQNNQPNGTNPSEDTQLLSDEKRQALVGYVGQQSKISQAEIYIKGSTGQDVELNSTQSLVENYLDVKKQNDAITAYGGSGA